VIDVPHNRRLGALFNRLKRGRSVWILTSVLGAAALLFVGCLSLTDSGLWRPHREEGPLKEVAVDRLIRVRLLGRNPRPAEQMAVIAPFDVSETSTGKKFGGRQGPMQAATVRPALENGIQLGERFIPSGDITITPARDAAIVLKERTYRGSLRIQRQGVGLAFTNHLDIEAYLRGVLRGELPRYFHPESFKAQCVAARTYALYTKAHSPEGRSFDVFDHEGSQVYIGVAAEDRVADGAVEATAGEVCAWGPDHDIFCTFYSSCCGGRSQHVNNVKTSYAAVPPLAGGVDCPDCYMAPHFKWGPIKLSKAELTKRLIARYPSLSRLGTIAAIRPKKTTSDGRVVSIELAGSGGGSETLVGEDFRLSIGARELKSTIFKIDDKKDEVVFRDGRGFGHGMGLCQYGMDTKARRGMDYKLILSAYYPGCQVIKLY